MAQEPDRGRLDALDARIRAAKGDEPEGPKAGDETYSQAGMAWQMVIELVVGLAIGFGIGYGLDAIFGTQPIFMVLFILLGFAAGVRVMLQTAKQMQAQQAARRAAEKEEG